MTATIKMSRGVRLLVALALSLALSICLYLALSPALARADAAGQAGELHVCPAGPPFCDYASIQDAIDAANAGVTIKVAMGRYTGVRTIPGLSTGAFTATQVVAIDKAITVRGGYTTADWDTSDPVAHLTEVDAMGAGRVMLIKGSGIAPVVEGLLLTGGDATGLGGGLAAGRGAGGGLYVSSAPARILNCEISFSSAYRGGGVWLQDSTATLQRIVIISNTAEWAGGGLWLQNSAATLNGNAILSNSAPYGGGAVLLSSDARLNGNAVLSNVGSDGEGGGLSIVDSDVRLADNLLRSNEAGSRGGGGLYLYGSHAVLTNTAIVRNDAVSDGSGLYAQWSTLELRHSTISGNGAGGDGIGMVVTDWAGADFSRVAMTNTIISGHATAGIAVAAGNSVTLTATLWHDNGANWSGAGTVDHTGDFYGDPAFESDGFRLTALSAAIDRGVATGVTTDIDEEARPSGSGPDLGADEFTGTPIAIRVTYLPVGLKIAP